MKKENVYEVGDLVVCIVDKYNSIDAHSVGIVRSQWHGLVNCMFGTTSGAFPCEEIKHLEVS